MSDSGVRRPATATWIAVWIAAAIVALAFGLRAGVSSIGVTLPLLRSDLGLSVAATSVLTALPVVCFAIFGLVGGRVAARIGVQRVTLLLLTALALGLIARSLTHSTAGFLVATIVAMAGAALGNVVLPPLAKRYFPHRLELISGYYGAAVVAGAAIPAALTAPVAGAAGGWQWALALWAIIPILALALWLPLIARERRRASSALEPTVVVPTSMGSVLRSRVGWALAIGFGAQSAQAYVQFGYWGDVLADEGVSAAHAGALLGVLAAGGIPISLLLPALFRLTRGTIVLPVAFGLVSVVGWIGLIVEPMLFDGWIWTVVLGIGGGMFPWFLAMIGLRSQTTEAATQLSAFVQGGGYILAATATFSAGILREISGSWTVPCLVLAAMAVVMAAAGAVAVRSKALA